MRYSALMLLPPNVRVYDNIIITITLYRDKIAMLILFLKTLASRFYGDNSLILSE